MTSTLTNQRRVFKACLTQKERVSDDVTRKIGPLDFNNFWINSDKTDHSGRVQAQTSLRPRITSQDLCALCLRRSQTLLLQRARKRAYIFKLHTYTM